MALNGDPVKAATPCVVSAVIWLDVNAATWSELIATMSEVCSEWMVEVGSFPTCDGVRLEITETVDIGARAP